MEWFQDMDYRKLQSHARWRDDLFPRDIKHVRVTDFLGANARVVHMEEFDLSGMPNTPFLHDSFAF